MLPGVMMSKSLINSTICRLFRIDHSLSILLARTILRMKLLLMVLITEPCAAAPAASILSASAADAIYLGIIETLMMQSRNGTPLVVLNSPNSIWVSSKSGSGYWETARGFGKFKCTFIPDLSMDSRYQPSTTGSVISCGSSWSASSPFTAKIEILRRLFEP